MKEEILILIVFQLVCRITFGKRRGTGNNISVKCFNNLYCGSKLKIAGIERDLQRFAVNDKLDIAAFILFGDVELTEK